MEAIETFAEVNYSFMGTHGIAKVCGFIVATLDHDDGWWYVRHDIVSPRHIVRYQTIEEAQEAINRTLA